MLKKLGCLGLAILILLGVLAGLGYAAWETDYLIRPLGWVVQQIPMEEEQKLRLASQVIERLAPPWDIVELKLLSADRVFLIATVPDFDGVDKPAFVQLWRAASRVGLVLNPDMSRLMMAFGEPYMSEYRIPNMYICPGEKRQFDTGHDCQQIPVYASLPVYSVRFAGK